MRTIGITIRRSILYLTSLVLVVGSPLAPMALAQEATTPIAPTEQTTVAPTTTETAPSASVATTTTQPAPEPVLVEPKPVYTYNSETERWDSTKWVYNPASGQYEAPPAPVVIEPIEEDTASKTGTGDGTALTVDNKVTVDNNLTSDATSGDSTVASNTTAGSATTGDSTVSATMLNTVNSILGTSENQKVATFTQDIMGDVKGDIMLYPMLLKTMLEAEAREQSSQINLNSNLLLTNNVDLNAQSGNAAVTGNTSAGSATTGSASAVANIVNILNSMIATQQSFVGTINIYGNLEGDILIAPDFIPQMLANNGTTETSATQLDTEQTTNIVNNISTVAESGAAAVFGNTAAGSAATGSADTNIVIFNLTGHQIVAKNSLLVFVNVMGRWVGVIVDAPTGATSALIGNGVESHTVVAPDLSIDAQSYHGIVNNISVNALSGDAEVSKNTSAGNATTGNASAAVNVANISNSQFGISDWFGVLFINVFQNWFGSFGVNTAYGDTPAAAAGKGAAGTTAPPSGVFQFIPKEESVYRGLPVMTVIDSRMVAEAAVVQDESDKKMPVAVLASSSTPPSTPIAQATEGIGDIMLDMRLWTAAGSLFLISVSLLGLKRLLTPDGVGA